jgi:nucleoside-diphosphate-sugar epimerase
VVSRSKKVLITGVDGFTGVYLENLLNRAGYDVYGLVYPKSAKTSHLLCNIADKGHVVTVLKSLQPDYVVHLAGISFVPHSDVRQIYDVNFFGTLNILDALIELDLTPDKVVLASSANVYGNPPVEIIDENVRPEPVSHYANSKLAMEFMARAYFDRLNILITRPFNYTGVGQAGEFLIPKIVAHFRERKKEVELGNLDVVRDFSDVRFVSDIYKRLMECDYTSEIVNVCSGRGISLLEIIGKMREMTGHRITTVKNLEFVRKNEVKTLIGSTRKLISLLGDQKTYSIEETLRWMLEAS